MKTYNDFKALFLDICEIKCFVLKLSSKDLRNFKNEFYNQQIPEWRLDLIWEYFFYDISYDEIYMIFKNSKII